MRLLYGTDVGTQMWLRHLEIFFHLVLLVS